MSVVTRNGHESQPAIPPPEIVAAETMPDSGRRGWVVDMLKGLAYALIIIACILFFTGSASRFIYVDF